jgi:hypothetical protein
MHFPDTFPGTREEQGEIAAEVWTRCGFESYERNSPSDHGGAAARGVLSFSAKKVAADMNRAGYPCHYEALVDSIRFEFGAVMSPTGDIYAPRDLSTSLLMTLWQIAKIKRVDTDRKRKWDDNDG